MYNCIIICKRSQLKEAPYKPPSFNFSTLVPPQGNTILQESATYRTRVSRMVNMFSLNMLKHMGFLSALISAHQAVPLTLASLVHLAVDFLLYFDVQLLIIQNSKGWVSISFLL